MMHTGKGFIRNSILAVWNPDTPSPGTALGDGVLVYSGIPGA
jgi:hypothetical protein